MVPTKLRILYGDTDRMGVVYYANYLRFFEAGRNELIRAKGARYRDIEAKKRAAEYLHAAPLLAGEA